MLNCRGVSKHFGGTYALRAVDLNVAGGQVVGLIGPNGSGKTTLVNVISGFYKPDAGEIHFDETRISGRPAFELRRMGIARAFQNLRLFDDLTVVENLLIGAHVSFLTGGGGSWRWLFSTLGTPGMRKIEGTVRRHACERADAIGLGSRLEDKVRNLSYGEKKRLDLARALMTEPHLLLLDEPTAGLSAEEAEEVILTIRQFMNLPGRSALLIDHRLDFILNISNWVVVLNAGSKIAEGTPEEISTNEEVIRVYLGE